MKKLCLPLIACIMFSQVVSAIGVPTGTYISTESEKFYCSATLEDDFLDDTIIVVVNETTSKQKQRITVADFQSSAISSVKYLSDDIPCLDAQYIQLGFDSAKDDALTESGNFQDVVILELKTKGKQNVLDTIKQLEKLDFVESAEPNYLFSADDGIGDEMDDNEVLYAESANVPSLYPNDVYFSYQYALSKIRVSDAWQVTTGSASVQVGVLDSGISSHYDLNSNVTTGWDFVNNNSVTMDDPTGHGTHVAGIIGATGNDVLGVCGVNWEVQLVPLQIIIDDGSEYQGYFSHLALMQAIEYATLHSIPILNYSGGSYQYDNALKRVIEKYPGLFICSAGNETTDTDMTPHYPSSYDCDNIISVAATCEYNDSLFFRSNYGVETVDLGAPGEIIYSTVLDGLFGYKSGTSMAAPFVTGVAALIKSVRPEMSAIQIKNCILQGVTPVESLNGKCVTGGLLNAKGAMEKAGLIQTTKIVSGDYNGDGKDDVAEVIRLGDYRTQFQVQLSTGSGFGDPVAWYDNASYAAAGIDQRAVAGDFNGDGKDDLAVLYNYGDGDLKFFTYLSNGSQFSTSQQWNDWHADADYIDNRFVAGDFNGDGKDDVAVMFRYPSGTVNIFTFVSNGGSFTRQTWNEWSADMTCVENRFVAGDFNGDGKDDVAVMFRYPSGTVNIFTFLSNGSSFARQTWSEWSADMSYVENRFVAGDFNGDGKDDTAVLFCYPDGAVNLFVFQSNGTSFTRVNWLNWSANANYIENRFTVGDFDGNSKDDAVVLFKYPSGQANLFTFMSTGGYFTRENWYQWDA